MGYSLFRIAVLVLLLIDVGVQVCLFENRSGTSTFWYWPNITGSLDGTLPAMLSLIGVLLGVWKWNYAIAWFLVLLLLRIPVIAVIAGDVLASMMEGEISVLSWGKMIWSLIYLATAAFIYGSGIRKGNSAAVSSGSRFSL